MGWNDEPEKLELIWEPPPELKVKRYRGWKWERLLNPIRDAPGASARIGTYANKNHAHTIQQRAKSRLRDVCPLEDWSFVVRQLQDDSGYCGLFATFNGMMTKEEFHRREILRMERVKRQKLVMEKRKLKRELGELVQPDPRRR